MKVYLMSAFEMVDGVTYRNENKMFTNEGEAVAAMNNKADDWKAMFFDDGEGEDVSKWSDVRLFNEVKIIANNEYDGQKTTMLYIVISEAVVEFKQTISVL